MVEQFIETEEEMLAVGREFAARWGMGDIVLLTGELGAGKTTLVRGVMEGLGWEGVVRSPTFNLMQVYPTKVPVVHADLYRVANAAGIGLEEYFDDHLCLIEWPDRLGDLVDPANCWRVTIEFDGNGRKLNLESPSE
jgi:tRNA threonylcarbamoyladenosine biosynthesis protein TsaE